MTDRWRTAGVQATQQPDGMRSPLPWNFDNTVFRCAWEYSAADFEAEFGFWVEALGFSTRALDGEYALFTTPDNDLAFACPHREQGAVLSGHLLRYMTRDLETFGKSRDARLPAGDITRREGSPAQTDLGLKTPAGLQVNSWKFPSGD